MKAISDASLEINRTTNISSVKSIVICDYISKLVYSKDE